jgi:hypothetical protein
MNDWTSWLLWADRDKFRHMGEGFRGENAQVETSEILIALVCLAGLIIALWVLSSYVARRERSKRTYSPRGLFHQLCQAHGLDRAGRTALWRLSKKQQLEHPARLFLEPERFEEPSVGTGHEGETYRQLKLKLFAELPTGEPT